MLFLKKERRKDHSIGCTHKGMLACIWVIAGLFVPGLLHGQGPEGKGRPPPAVVVVASILEKEVMTRITLVGTGEPWIETVVASEEEGVVRKIFIEEGDYVKKNQLLCEQDNTRLKLDIEAARFALSEAKILRSKAKRDWERQEQLFDINSVSGKAYDDARFTYGAARKKVNRLRATRKSLEDQLTKKQIKAPLSGYVVKRYCQVGQWLGEGDPVVTLVVPDPILFMVPVPERYIPSIIIGDNASVTFDALPGKIFQGRIEAVIPKADKAARTFPVRINIANPEGAIKPGMLGRATLPAGKPHKAILVPKDALVLSGNGKVVYVVIDQTARMVPVETGASHGPLIEVKGDLKPDLKVVVRGNERLRPGQAVQIVPGSSPP